MLQKKDIFTADRSKDERLTALEMPSINSRLTPEQQDAVRIKESATLVKEYVLSAKYSINDLSANTLYAALKSDDQVAVSTAAWVIGQRRFKDGLDHLAAALNHDYSRNLALVDAIGEYRLSACGTVSKIASLVSKDMNATLGVHIVDALIKIGTNDAYGVITSIGKLPQKEIASYARSALKKFN